MTIGRHERWWNRRIPGRPFLFAAVIILTAGYFWIYFGNVTTALAWDIAHGRTARFRGQSLKLPWFWKEERWTNYNEFTVKESGSRSLEASVTVRFGHFDPLVMQQRLTHLKNMPGLPGWISDDYPSDDFTRTHYRCARNGFRASAIFMVDCFSVDGRWAVHLVGPPETYPEFEEILRGVAGMGNPTK
jgi:hypothetical protein